MYREKIREKYDRLSRSYRKVADFIMSNYYEVSFMTAAQLAYTVDVDTTTVVRFSQRLEFDGYPDLLNDIRDQVRSEVYAAYEPKQLTPGDPAGVFKDHAEQQQSNLRQMLVHNPPDHVRRIATLVENASTIAFVAEGYASVLAEMATQQLRHRGIRALHIGPDPILRAAALMNLDESTLVIGISATEYGHDVARTMEYLHDQGCPTIGIVGSLASPVNRVSDQMMYAPTASAGPLPDIIALSAATSGLVQIACRDSDDSSSEYLEAFERVFNYLRGPEKLSGVESAGDNIDERGTTA